MDPSKDDFGNYSLSEVIPQLFDTIRSVEAAYAEYPQAAAAVAEMSRLLTDERLALAQRADTDLAAAKRLEKLLYALNERFTATNELKFGLASSMAEIALKDRSTPIVMLITHGLAIIYRIEQEHAS